MRIWEVWPKMLNDFKSIRRKSWKNSGTEMSGKAFGWFGYLRLGFTEKPQANVSILHIVEELDGNKRISPGWSPTTEDLRADDWEVM